MSVTTEVLPVLDEFECSICQREVPVIDWEDMPSMMGHGTDTSLELACGHYVTFDPFTGRATCR